MKMLTQAATKNAEPLELKGLPVPSLRVVVVDAARVIETPRGNRFEFIAARPTRDARNCPHAGEMLLRGRRVQYAWARSRDLKLRCGDCGAILE